METKNITVVDLATDLKKYSNIELHQLESRYQGNAEILVLARAERDRRFHL